VAAVENVGDLIDPLGPGRGVAGGGAQVEMAEAAETSRTATPASSRCGAQ
jgi:hypothetical protein